MENIDKTNNSGIYKSCYWVNSGLHFTRNNIRFCCYEYLQLKDENIIISDYNGKKLDYETYFNIKEKYKTLAKNNTIHPNCNGCMYLVEKLWSDENYFDHFIFNHWLNCNSKCIYCGQSILPRNERKQYYNVYPVIKDIKNNKLLKATKDNCIVFGGGEPTILNEFDKLLNLFCEENFNNIRINSSGIKYSHALTNALKNRRASLVISVDSGTKDKYIQIKQVNAFDKVWSNIREYIKKSNGNSDIIIKYILIPAFNTSKEDIDNFFNQVVKNNVEKVSFSVEQAWYNNHYPDFPDSIYDTIDYFLEKIEKNSLEYEIYCEAQNIINCRKGDI